MLPCGRGALVSKSAGFKKIPENVKIKYKCILNSIQKQSQTPVQIYPNNDTGKYRKVSQQILSISGTNSYHPFANTFKAVLRFFSMVFGTFAGQALKRFLMSKCNKRVSKGAKFMP